MNKMKINTSLIVILLLLMNQTSWARSIAEAKFNLKAKTGSPTCIFSAQEQNIDFGVIYKGDGEDDITKTVDLTLDCSSSVSLPDSLTISFTPAGDVLKYNGVESEKNLLIPATMRGMPSGFEYEFNLYMFYDSLKVNLDVNLFASLEVDIPGNSTSTKFSMDIRRHVYASNFLTSGTYLTSLAMNVHYE
ncbi:type 1 fimbrial protein [Salmonella enterica subsp. enterica]|nr:type 1 fimbrial protein [Salmonella enterica subsp. enterica]